MDGNRRKTYIKKKVVDKLNTIGYIHEGDLGIKDREAFDYSDKPNLMYVCPGYSDELHIHITVRKFLESTTEAVEKYSKVKESASELFSIIYISKFNISHHALKNSMRCADSNDIT